MMLRFTLLVWTFAISCAFTEAGNNGPCGADVTAIAPETAVPAADVTLRYKFQPGQVVRYLVDDKSTVDLEYGQQKGTCTYQTTSWKHYTVKSVNPDGSAVLELVIDRAKMQVQEQDRLAIAYDSQAVGAAPKEFAALAALIQQPRTITVTATGVIETAENAPEIQAHADAIDQQNTNVLIVLPENGVSVGGSWKDDFQVSVKIKEVPYHRFIRLRRHYMLTAIDAQTATIDLQTIVLTPLDDPAIEAQLLQRTPNGVIRFDLASGRILERQARVNNQVVNFEGPGSKIKVDRRFSETITTDDGTQKVAGN
jgi:hypothetical protein